jgi:hypothetical protein
MDPNSSNPQDPQNPDLQNGDDPNSGDASNSLLFNISYKINKYVGSGDEGIGLTGAASFFVSGNINGYTNDDGSSSLVISANGSTPLSQIGTPQFYGTANLTVDGNVVQTQQFQISSLNGIYMYNSDNYPIGIVRFNLPTSGNVQVNLSFGYILVILGNQVIIPQPNQASGTFSIPNP